MTDKIIKVIIKVNRKVNSEYIKVKKIKFRKFINY